VTDLDERRAAAMAAAAELRAVADLLASTDPDLATLDRVRERAASVRELLADEAVRPSGWLPTIDDMHIGRRSFNPAVGAANPASPPLDIVTEPGSATCEFTLGRRFEGPPGFVHGGITGLVLDEVLGRAALSNGGWGMTVFLNLTYLAGLPIDVPLRATATIESQQGRKTFVRGRIATCAEPERACVEAEAMFVHPNPDTFERYFGHLRDGSGRPLELDLHS
jgi:acyl-coenzyme A thioesterase PaaI-like protein